MTKSLPASLAIALAIATSAHATSMDTHTTYEASSSIRSRAATVIAGMQAGACEALAKAQRLGLNNAADRLPVPSDPTLRRAMAQRCAETAEGDATRRKVAAFEDNVESSQEGVVIPDGTLLDRQELIAASGVVVDLVAYSSSNLVVGGILCYRNDGLRRSTVLHQHGGYGGIFINTDGNMLETCLNWALLHNRNAFAASYRGQDGGEGQLEICLGEADDVAAAAIMVRALPISIPERLAVIGGSVGACVTMRAAAKIPSLRAVAVFVPPFDWKALVNYHRSGFVAATEIGCDGSSIVWDQGGSEIADFIDIVMCGQIGCPDEAYNIRSPLLNVTQQTVPTMVVVAGSDNLVPTEQQLLWSILRENEGHPVLVASASKCDPALPAQLLPDLLLYVNDGYHGLAAGPVGSGFLFVMDALDQGVTPATPDPRD